jgi:hypothetical protein
MVRSKLPSSYRLSEGCQQLLKQMSDHLGISQAGVIEQAVRKLARAEGVEAESGEKPATPKKPGRKPKGK